MSSRRRAYYRYLESAHWKQLRVQAFERDGYRCQKCGSSNKLRGHHVRYRKELTTCTVGDIQTLCEKCHDKHHKEQKRLRKLNRKSKRERYKIKSHLVYLLLTFDADP